MIIRMVVVLPAPLGPMTPYNAPCGTTRSMPSTATVDPKVFLNRLSSSAGTIGLAWDQNVTVDAMRLWWVPLAALIAPLISVAACTTARDANEREYELHGQILAVHPERTE